MAEKKRDPSRTKRKLLEAVGNVLAKKGFTELKVNNICEESGIDKKLIYFHFGDLNGLIEHFLKSNDFWMTAVGVPAVADKDASFELFKRQFATLHESSLLKNLLAWELSDRNPVLRKLADDREELGDRLIDLYKQQQNPKADVNPIFALLVSGIYYLTIHNDINGSAFCGLNLNEEKDRERVLDGIRSIIDKCL
ncbi:TetR/AcrR family transcriptional regulator [Sphingobacterium sp. LRF_L2]|uniref:TetR/AcrR family transcriptional regulator n=1 Tax=Sphingobacterium sp. LRF_L2 TaxID=3369421 RepID=UPI003F5FCE30